MPVRSSWLIIQGWWGLAVWLSLGLLLEGLIGFRTSAYLLDPIRRDLFRLAHAHGTIFSILLLVTALFLERGLSSPPAAAIRTLQIGTVMMPLGFLLGGIRHTETDPNLLVLLSPLGGLLIIFAVIAIAFSHRKQ